jgi:hypothetical protein
VLAGTAVRLRDHQRRPVTDTIDADLVGKVK